MCHKSKAITTIIYILPNQKNLWLSFVYQNYMLAIQSTHWFGNESIASQFMQNLILFI